MNIPDYAKTEATRISLVHYLFGQLADEYTEMGMKKNSGEITQSEYDHYKEVTFNESVVALNSLHGPEKEKAKKTSFHAIRGATLKSVLGGDR